MKMRFVLVSLEAVLMLPAVVCTVYWLTADYEIIDNAGLFAAEDRETSPCCGG